VILLPSGATGQGLVKVSFAQAQDLLSFAPAYIARAKFFKEMGIDPQFDILSGGGPVFAALSGGSVQFGLTASADLVNRASKGEDFVAIEGLNFQTIEVVMNKDWATRKGVTKSSTLKARVEAMRGTIIASTSPGAISDTMAQYLLRWGGMDPSRDAQIVPIGGLPPRMAALESGRVQVLLSSPPAGQEAEKKGFGITIIPAKDLPGFNRQIHEILIARKSWLNRNKDLATRVVTALAMGNNFFLDNFNASIQMHMPFYPDLGRDVLEPGLRSVRAQTIRNGVMKAEDWVKTMELLRSIKAVEGEISIQEGAYWTNAYIDQSKLKH
jgi:ABC-type nitrate/sulfonate/bicarbonate transport system substrate-binding protein